MFTRVKESRQERKCIVALLLAAFKFARTVRRPQQQLQFEADVYIAEAAHCALLASSNMTCKGHNLMTNF